MSSPAPNAPAPDQVRRVLVAQTAGIGDALLSTPAIEALAEHYRPEVLDTLSKPIAVEVFARLPSVTKAHALERTHRGTWRALRAVRRAGYDLYVDLHGKARTTWLAALGGVPHRLGYDRARIGVRARAFNLHGVELSAYSAAGRLEVLAPLGIQAGDPTPRFDTGAEAAALAERAFEEAGLARGAVALAPSSRFPPKSWPHANWVALARGLAADGAQVFAVAPPGDTQGVPRMAVESGGALAVIPARDLAFLAALYARASLVVADCSGPRHLATSQGTPTLTLHGSTDPVTWTHPDPRHRWVAADVHCRPCCQVTCPLGTVECMAELSVEQVLDAARTATGGTG